MKLKVLGAALATVLAMPATAATLDFITLANNNERGITSGNSIVMDGVNVTFSANSTYYAYLDSGDAGLGVCQVVDTADYSNGGQNRCITPGSGSSDDNVTVGESVTISFDVAMELSNLLFSKEGHTLFGNSATDTLLFAINGGTLERYTIGELMSLTFYGVLSATFGYDSNFFTYNDRQVTQNANQFYLASAVVNPVPVPAALPLLLAGLGGLGVMARRRRKTA